MKNLKNLIKKELDKLVNEGIEPEQTNYMFFSNLKQIHRQCELLLNEFDPNMIDSLLENGHDWASDHIAEAKNNMDQVFDFLMNEKTKNGNMTNVNEQDMGDDSITVEDIESLKKINYRVNRQDVIQWFNDNDVEYYNMTDIEMYIHYLENDINSGSYLNEEHQIDESKNKPTNPKLWASSLAWAKSRYKVCPSAYCNGAAAKHYKSKGGKWKKIK